jgi:hypothetical protein
MAVLAWRWRATVDGGPSSPEALFDLNSDGAVDADDLALFSEFWLEQSD